MSNAEEYLCDNFEFTGTIEEFPAFFKGRKIDLPDGSVITSEKPFTDVVLVHFLIDGNLEEAGEFVKMGSSWVAV